MKKNEGRRKIVHNPRTDTLQLFFAKFKEKKIMFSRKANIRNEKII